MLEIAKVQPQHVAEHLGAEDGVDPVTRVKHHVLAQPGHGGVEDQEHHEAYGNGDQRARRVVDHYLVDDHLREKRRREAYELNEQRCKQDIAPNPAMPEQLRPEPPEAEAGACRGAVAGKLFRKLMAGEKGFGLEPVVSGCARLRRLAARLEIEVSAFVAPQHERRAARFFLKESDARKGSLG
jgi:hypothetical protein